MQDFWKRAFWYLVSALVGLVVGVASLSATWGGDRTRLTHLEAAQGADSQWKITHDAAEKTWVADLATIKGQVGALIDQMNRIEGKLDKR